MFHEILFRDIIEVPRLGASETTPRVLNTGRGIQNRVNLSARCSIGFFSRRDITKVPRLGASETTPRGAL